MHSKKKRKRKSLAFARLPFFFFLSSFAASSASFSTVPFTHPLSFLLLLLLQTRHNTGQDFDGLLEIIEVRGLVVGMVAGGLPVPDQLHVKVVVLQVAVFVVERWVGGLMDERRECLCVKDRGGDSSMAHPLSLSFSFPPSFTYRTNGREPAIE